VNYDYAERKSGLWHLFWLLHC